MRPPLAGSFPGDAECKWAEEFSPSHCESRCNRDVAISGSRFACETWRPYEDRHLLSNTYSNHIVIVISGIVRLGGSTCGVLAMEPT